MSRLFVLAFAFLMLAMQPARAEDPFFEGLAGNWNGSGFVRLTANAQEENIRCRLSTISKPNGKELGVLGNCALSSFMLPVTGSIIATGGTKYTSTVFGNLAQLSTSNFSGRRSGSSLHLKFRGKDMQTGQIIDSSLTIRKRGKGRFDVTIKRTDPGSGALFNVGVISFKGS